MPKLNKYKLNHHWLQGLTMGELTPFFMQEVSPGEVFKGFSNAVFRMAPMDYPMFMQMNIHAHIFYCPYRLVLDEFPEMWTGEDTSTAWPTITYGITDQWAKFGIQPITAQTPTLNALPVRVWNTIWNEHFRNELEQSARSLDKIDTMPKVHHSSQDYYGSIQTELAQAGGTSEQVTVTGGVWDVVDYRDAANRQRYKERRAAFGERYEDVLLTEHGIDISDTRLNKPEHCAHARATVGISEVTVTASSTGQEAGEYVGHGITGMKLNFPARKFPEPGLLMGVMYARPRLQLDQRIDHIWFTQDIEDLYHPHLNSDTQDIVSSGEIYSEAASYTNFGYIGKYDHLRKARDNIAGKTEIHNYAANVELSSTPTVAYLHQVQTQNNWFQDQTSSRSDLRCFFDHNISKLSPIPRRKK